MVKFIIIFTALILSISAVQAAPKLTAQNAILSIIGEAENQGPRGMLAVGCAIRSRNGLHGVYGLNNPRVRFHRYSASTYKTAKMAWAKSAQVSACRFIGGANGWENVNKYGSPAWVRFSTLTAVIGDHRFYIQNTKPKGVSHERQSV